METIMKRLPRPKNKMPNHAITWFALGLLYMEMEMATNAKPMMIRNNILLTE